MSLNEDYVYLIFDIHFHDRSIGEVQFPIQKHRDIEKWKNPDLVKIDAINVFKNNHKVWENFSLCAYYKGDFVDNFIKTITWT